MLRNRLEELVPQGDKRTAMRLWRTQRLTDAVESTIGDTLQQEDAVLVVIDPSEFPKSWNASGVKQMILKNSEFGGIWNLVVVSVFLLKECVHLSSSELVRIASIDLC